MYVSIGRRWLWVAEWELKKQTIKSKSHTIFGGFFFGGKKKEIDVGCVGVEIGIDSVVLESNRFRALLHRPPAPDLFDPHWKIFTLFFHLPLPLLMCVQSISHFFLSFFKEESNRFFVCEKKRPTATRKKTIYDIIPSVRERFPSILFGDEEYICVWFSFLFAFFSFYARPLPFISVRPTKSNRCTQQQKHDDDDDSSISLSWK